MKPKPPEFSRPLPVDRVPAGGSDETLVADTDECQALARRLGLPAMHGLTARLRATPWRGGGLRLEGEVVIDIDQVSVVSLERFRSEPTIRLERYFLPRSALAGNDEAEADPIINGEVDLGEVVAETLALELDPYPRKPGENFVEHVEFEEETSDKASPFAALTKLQRK